MRSSSSLMRFGVHVVDWFAFAGAGLAAYVWRFEAAELPPPQIYALLIVQMATLMLLVSSAIYRNWRGGKFKAMLGRVGLAWAITWALLMTWLVLTKSSTDFSRIWLLTWAALSLGVSWVARLALFLTMAWLRGQQVNHMRVLLVGRGGPVAAIRRRVKTSNWTGYDLVGVVGVDDINGLQYALGQLDPDEVWICPSANDMNAIQPVLNELRHSTANIRLVPDMGAFQLVNNGLTVVLGMPMLDISSSPMSGINLVLKWLEDRIVGFLILVLISPVLLGVALAVKLTSKGPVIFKQERHGWNGETIEVYKFRSMYVHDEHTGQVTQAKKGDSRITPLGAFLRRSSLDELPQFVNVLQGRMSIVGPRPHAVAHNLQYRELIPRYMLRHKVKPGITGWAQVNGLRGETDTIEKMEARVQADLYYIENWSVMLDLKIIFLTFFKGFFNKNAY
ncbi:undecaprenyl-phosphate glucose phosphotransferase [Curvibacter sp. RS43]|uniref:undecaprenyl-phosphate glucose phosphotransferase n=1 Tax=Curvibacter microcysteis TaxID=3026419 RepID=UPI0023613DAA|nr:undecaprenyl-phosphate glucose phosphotransferase [Curvibacter sp. RS43]MDD0809487.1 undecaprenyl-phosphate glucose phosphotransferase [Curvibacter sp. RS43]